MKSRDRNLGMDRAISRRDLLHGMGAQAAGALCTPPNQMFALENTGAAGYPPALTGFRGSHVGSFEVAHQLAGMLGSGGFDPARDIEGITVNRWPHGYSYSWYNPLFDKVYWEDDDERYPHIRARKRFGRIAIANADAGANAMLETAVEQGHRAVTELT